MANTFGPLAPVNFTPMVQDYLESYLVATQISNTKWNSLLRSGQSIDFPTTTDMRSQTYTPGTDLTIDDNVAASNTMLINQSRAVTFTMDPNTQAQAEDKGVQAKLAARAGYITAKQIDQSVLSTAVTGAGNTVAGGTLTASSVYQVLAETMATLQRSEGADGPMFAVLDPERVALLAQSEVANGFNLADSAHKNGFVGNSASGFKIFNSNNLPNSVTLSMATQPTNLDTTTIAGVTWTWVTDSTAASAGEINIGANAADAQAIFVTAINGTTPPTAGDYVDVSTANRRILQNGNVSCSAFAANVATITSNTLLAPSETFTAAGNVFGTETSSLLAGRFGAPSLAMQINPTLASAQEPARPMETNYALHTLYGRAVFSRDAFRLAAISINV